MEQTKQTNNVIKCYWGFLLILWNKNNINSSNNNTNNIGLL